MSDKSVLKRMRLHRRMGLRQFAEHAAVDTHRYPRIESGEIEATDEELAKIAAALNAAEKPAGLTPEMLSDEDRVRIQDSYTLATSWATALGFAEQARNLSKVERRDLDSARKTADWAAWLLGWRGKPVDA